MSRTVEDIEAEIQAIKVGSLTARISTSEKKIVHFEYQQVSVFHWNNKDYPKTIQFDPETVTLYKFKQKLRAAFAEEIVTDLFSVYEYPRLFHDPKDSRRIYISSDELLKATLLRSLDPDRVAPIIFVWNEPGAQYILPSKLPTGIILNEDMATKSRYKTTFTHAKERDNLRCVVCELLGKANLEGCHIYEIKHYSKVPAGNERLQMLDTIGLSDINQVSNLVTMCRSCHRYFDQHDLGIHPENFSVIVTETIRNELANPYSKTFFSELHGKIIPKGHLQVSAISQQAILYRFSNYFMVNKNEHYRWKCPSVFQVERDHIASNSCSLSVERVAVADAKVDAECEYMIHHWDYISEDELPAYESFVKAPFHDGKPLIEYSKFELQDFLRSIKGKISGSNDELVNRIYQFSKTQFNGKVPLEDLLQKTLTIK